MFVGDSLFIAGNMWGIFVCCFLLVWSVLFIFNVSTRSETSHIRDKQRIYFVTLILAAISLSTMLPLLLLYINAYIHAQFPFSNVDYNSLCSDNIDFFHLYAITSAIFLIDGFVIYTSLVGAYLQRATLMLKGSFLQISNRPKISFGIFFVALFVGSGIGIWATFKKRNSIRSLVIVSAMLAFVIESGYIWYVLTEKLIHFIKYMKNQISQGFNYTSNSNININKKPIANTHCSAKINDKNEEKIAKQVSSQVMPLCKQTRKLSILSGLTFIATLMNAIVIAVLRMTLSEQNIGMILVFVISIDAIINFSCLTFQFVFSQTIYNKTFKVLERLPIFKKLEMSLKDHQLVQANLN